MSEIQTEKQPDQNVDVNAALVESAVKIITEQSTESVLEDEHLEIEDIDEVLEKTRKAHATFIPENKTEDNLKQSLNLANSLDHVAIESTDIDSVRNVI